MKLRKKLKTIFKNTHHYLREKNWREFYICDREYYPKLEPYLHNLEQLIEHENTVLLKKGTKTSVFKIEIEGLVFVLKYFKVISFLNLLKRAISPSRAVICWRNAHRLKFSGLRTPEPIAVYEHRFGPFRHKAFYLMSYVDGKTCKDYVLEKPEQGQLAAAKNIVSYINNISTKGINHGDMNANNIIFIDEQPVIVDLDAMEQPRTKIRFRYNQRRDYERFLETWETHPKIHDLFNKLLGCPVKPMVLL